MATKKTAPGAVNGARPACCARDAARPGRTRLLWLGIDNVSFDEALDAIVALCRRAEPAYVVTPNVDHFMRVRRDDALRGVYERADLVLADGMPLLWAARLLGRPLKEKVSGSDLFGALCERAARDGLRVFLLGGAPGIAEKAARAMCERYPGLTIAGTCSPTLNEAGISPDDDKTIRTINDARPHVVFVAFGCPKQEWWMARNYKLLGGAVCIGVGASFDFAAGAQRRAPRWMQRAGLEWFWRLLHEPGRLWRRYIVNDLPFVWWLACERAGLRAQHIEAAKPAPAGNCGPRVFNRTAFDQAYADVILTGRFCEKPAYYRFRKGRYYRTLRHICRLPLPRAARILEIGGGQIALLCSRLFGDICTVGDVSDAFAESITQHGLEFVRCNLLEDDLDRHNFYDLVILCEVVEHLPVPPYTVLEKVRLWLKPGGWLVLTTPNLYSIRNVLRLAMGKKILDRFQYPAPGAGLGHQLEYDAKHLRWQLESAGFYVERVEYRQLTLSGSSAVRKMARLAVSPLMLLPRWRESLVAYAQRPISESTRPEEEAAV